MAHLNAAGATPPAIDVPDPLASRPSIRDVYTDGSKMFSVQEPLPAEEQSQIMESILDHFHLEEEDQDTLMSEGAQEINDVGDQARRTGYLRGTLDMLAKLYWTHSQVMDLVAEKLADGSRDPKWRIPLGDSGILNFFLQILGSPQDLRHTLKIHVLRLIGNSCADTDENRARLVASACLPSIIQQLQDTSVLAFAIPVLYNICVDYEPAQRQASSSMLSQNLIELISSPRFDDSKTFLGYICKLLDLMASQASEPELAPDNTATVLLRLAADKESPTDLEDFIALANTAVTYLKHEKFQKALIQQGALDTTLSVLVDSYTRFDWQPSLTSVSPDEDDAKMLFQMRSDLNQVLSDVSALPEFKEVAPVGSPLAASLRRWLSSPQLQLQMCACIILGNLGRSDNACEEFVHTYKVHQPLIAIINNANDPQLLHAALGFLRNLALPQGNKKYLGDAGIFDCLPRLWDLDTLQQIQFSSVSLARQLLVGTFDNVRRICRRLSTDEASPASSRTQISLLIALFERTDVEPIKMEISRLVTAVCRVYNTTKDRPAEKLKEMREFFFSRHPEIGLPLSFMVSQSKWPVVRSEGWFVFALMARYPEGAECISDLMHDVKIFQPLVKLLTGQDLVDYKPAPPSSPEISTTKHDQNPLSTSELTFSTHAPEIVQPNAQSSEMTRIDRENALVLVSELLKNRGEQMALMRRTVFRDLLRGGSQILMTYKETIASMGERPVPKEKPRGGLGWAEVAEQSMSELS